MKRFIRIFFWSLLSLVIFFFAYTFYCLFAVPDLCDLAKINPKTTAFIEDRKEEWKDNDLRRRINQRWVPLSAVSRDLKNAVVVTEDPNFYHHSGIDFYAIFLAAKQDFERQEIISGASTITQQLMKNLYLSASRNPLRKWKEAILAMRVERCVGKSRILEVYLNVIEWGESVYGIEAASRKYFGKPAAALDPAESALLTAMIPNPIYYNPYRKNPKLWRNKNLTLRLMLRAGYLSRARYDQAVNEPIRLR